MEDGVVAITSRRLFLMFMALIAPELMVTWSARQFFSARESAKKYNSFGAELQVVQVIGDGQNAGEEDTAILLAENPRSQESNSLDPSAPRTDGIQFAGQD